MVRARVIPVLLFKNQGLVKTVRFGDEVYVGDPVNAVKIFNEKQCDELIILDITATKQKKGINFKLVEEIATECFMPLSYGGGISDLHQVEKLLKLGIEKVILNSVLIYCPSFMKEAVKSFGSSTIVASIDIKLNMLGQYRLFSHAGYDVRRIDLTQFVEEIVDSGVGEVMITSVDRDGTMSGYDLQLALTVTGKIGVPVVFCGGAKDFDNIKELLTSTNINAAAAGSLFVFHGRHRGVLISYPTPEQIGDIYS
jgi:imidazole glycerol-phosphate synthase subunit HisF